VDQLSETTDQIIILMKAHLTLALLLGLAGIASGQTMSDTIYNYITHTPVTVDGQATEACWADAQWHAIDQVWIPYDAIMKYGDFEGRFKVAWDPDYLYMLVEVLDDSLSDDHADPLSNWWDDDCLEIFIDENRSMGDHERNCNAFAYHVSLSYDAVDLDASGQGINYKNNLEVDMDTVGEHLYLWELAIKIYDATFNPSNPEKSRVILKPNKLMGLAVAYCDNDETTARENFIGSMYMTEPQANDMYKNADHFGPMLLLDPEDHTGMAGDQEGPGFRVFPVPALDAITLVTSLAHDIQNFSIFTLTGQRVSSGSFTGTTHTLSLKNLEAGTYLLEVKFRTGTRHTLIIKQ
jgi:hypothetical protein